MINEKTNLLSWRHQSCFVRFRRQRVILLGKLAFELLDAFGGARCAYVGRWER